MQDENEIESCVISGTTRSFKTLQDGTLVLSVDVPPYLAMQAIQLLGSTEPGVNVAIARVNSE